MKSLKGFRGKKEVRARALLSSDRRPPFASTT